MPPPTDTTPGDDDESDGLDGLNPSSLDPSDPAAPDIVGANDEALLIRIHGLEEEHADLDHAIEALSRAVGHDRLALARLKKRKLSLKDQIRRLKDQLTPNIIA